MKSNLHLQIECAPRVFHPAWRVVGRERERERERGTESDYRWLMEKPSLTGYERLAEVQRVKGGDASGSQRDE